MYSFWRIYFKENKAIFSSTYKIFLVSSSSIIKCCYYHKIVMLFIDKREGRAQPDRILGIFYENFKLTRISCLALTCYALFF